jgi:hypothetical protein
LVPPLLVKTDCRAFTLADANAGRSRLARIAMMAITTSNSISVNPRERELETLLLKDNLT